jgi:glycosyltransferase involved in cell wall biosynthesis
LLLSQTEIVLRDNASTDSTEAICRAYADRGPRIRYERSDDNCGAAFNYRRTLELTCAPYFKWNAAGDTVRRAFWSSASRSSKPTTG